MDKNARPWSLDYLGLFGLDFLANHFHYMIL